MHNKALHLTAIQMLCILVCLYNETVILDFMMK